MKYIKRFIYYINHIIVTLKFSILSLFISMFTLASIILIAVNYKNATDNIIFIANKSMEDVAHSLEQKFSFEIQLAERDAEVTTGLIKTNVINIDNVNEMINYFFTLALQFDFVQAIYWGDVNGNYISGRYEDDDSISSDFFNTNLPYSDFTIKRDIKGNVLKTIKLSLDYDPRKRPWYLQAVKNGKSAWTDVYLNQADSFLKITLITPIYEKDKQLKGVLGLDVRLDWISWYINQLKVTEGTLFIVRQDGKIIGYPHFDELPKQNKFFDIHKVTSKWIDKSFDLYKKNHSHQFSFRYNGINYLATYQPMPILKEQGWLIGLVIPENTFIGNLNQQRILNIVISLLIMMLGIALMSKLVNSIVRPVKSLIVETEKIKNFDLDSGKKIRSRLKEIILLSDAIYTMKQGLKAFKQYVPSELVKQLIEKGENTHIGGSKKQLVSFFSDIQNFTSIVHESNPNELVSQLNEYFELLTKIIIKEGGTVDKYIGDAIMAFWGAPNEIANPCHHAANTALVFIEQLEILNRKWMSENKSPFYTRIGIHVGDAIVGNVGSSDRINYTAIGDSINIASRLEEINKELNTNILVSEAVYLMIENDFILKNVGFVSLKGIPEKVKVYELIGRKLA